MAHVWTKSDAGEWQPTALAADACALTPRGPLPPRTESNPPADCTSAVLLRRVEGAEDDAWALVAGPDARILVNGLPTPLRIVVLVDHDEIRWPTGSPIFFSTERLAVVVPYPADGRRGCCPRCKQTIAADDPAVSCPGCGLWHHASNALPCWTYGEHCAVCPQPTTIDAGFRWTPEEL